MDLEDLKNRLREAARTGKPDGYTMLATSEWADAANAIESLQRELENEKIESQTLRHGLRLADQRLRKYEALIGADKGKESS